MPCHNKVSKKIMTKFYIFKKRRIFVNNDE
jgi:hypothetical protein